MGYGQFFGSNLTDLQAAATAHNQLEEARHARDQAHFFDSMSQAAKLKSQERTEQANRALQYVQLSHQEAQHQANMANQNTMLNAQLASAKDISSADAASKERIAAMAYDPKRMDPKMAQGYLGMANDIGTFNTTASSVASQLNAKVNAAKVDLAKRVKDITDGSWNPFSGTHTEGGKRDAKAAALKEFNDRVTALIAPGMEPYVKWDPATTSYVAQARQMPNVGAQTAQPQSAVGEITPGSPQNFFSQPAATPNADTDYMSSPFWNTVNPPAAIERVPE